MTGEPSLSVAEAAARLGLSAHTLRYYERAGLIEPLGRDTAGRRRYQPADLDWFAFLIRLRQTGMPIRDMHAYAALRAQGAVTLAERRAMLERHRDHIAEQLTQLADGLTALDTKIAHYDHLIEQECHHG
ncbi:MAG: MerR family transcriptional regulator [Propionicimonas sp.]|uniref:MerR family transcriptional regulator n=1 Tax=Propionicimonas sp. TaxID=1955623 RepID=UPI003D09A06D